MYYVPYNFFIFRLSHYSSFTSGQNHQKRGNNGFMHTSEIVKEINVCHYISLYR